MTAPLTFERMRADIARAIHEEPENVGPHDNLLDLGLDSMRAMSLVLAWSEAGVELDFSVLAEQPTLGGWWEHAQAQLARSRDLR